MRQSHKTLLLWGVLIFGFVLVKYAIDSGQSQKLEVPFSDFLASLESDNLKSTEVEIKNNNEFFWTDKDRKKKALGVLSDDVLKQLREHNVKFKLTRDDEGAFWQNLLGTWVPLLLVFFVIFFLFRQMQAGTGRAMSFGKSKAKLMSEGSPKVTFKDVAGIEEAKSELEEIVDFLKDPKKFTRLGGRIPKGVLLIGPPGTGKTLLARAIAGEAAVPFFSISGSDFVEMFVGIGASRVRDLFEQSKKHAPCIIFIDEIDAVGRQRGAGVGGGHDEREQTLNQLLVEMDGFESSEGVILIAATNRADVLDPALLRPGRFDRRVVVELPDVIGRAQILRVHTRKLPLAKNVDIDVLARGTPGFSGATLENLANEAALYAARQSKQEVSQEDFEYAKDKVLMGAERKSMIISEKEKIITAYHEAGHTLVGKLLKDCDPVHKVTIIPRGRALGITQTLPEDDRHTQSKTYCLDRLAMLFGGRIAEELQFNEITTGAGNDISVATGLARRMVCEFGMSDKLGPITFGQREHNIFLGRDFNQMQEYSERTAMDIDDEVRRIMHEQYLRAKGIIETNRDKLTALAEALIAYETLDSHEIQILMDGQNMTRELPTSRMKSREDLEKQHLANTALDDAKRKQDLLGPLAGEIKV